MPGKRSQIDCASVAVNDDFGHISGDRRFFVIRLIPVQAGVLGHLAENVG